MHESILAFRKKRYLWLSLILGALAIVSFWIDDPQEPANGGTMLGYRFNGRIGDSGYATWFWLVIGAYSLRLLGVFPS